MLLETLARYAVGALAVVACFGFIIFIHELGHFLVARWAGIRCPEFAIGFGKKLFAFRWRATEFSVRIFPFGGFVMMTGEEPGLEDSWHNTLSFYLEEAPFPARPAQLMTYLEELKSKSPDMLDSPENKTRYDEVKEHLEFSQDRLYTDIYDLEGSFNRKPIPHRIAVVVGGVIMNFIAALILFWMVGAFWGVAFGDMVAEPMVASVLEGPAKTAGVKTGDVIVEVEGHKIETGQEMIQAIARYPGVPITIKVRRGKEILSFPLTPNANSAGIMFEPAGSQVRVQNAELVPKSPLKKGDVIVAVDGQKVTDMASFVDLLRQKTDTKKVTLEVANRGPVEMVAGPGTRLAPEGKIGVMPGRPIHIELVKDAVPLLIGVQPGSPAEQAGLKVKDGILEVDGKHVFGQSDLSAALQSKVGQEVKLLIARDEDTQDIELKVPEGGLSALGITLQPVDAAYVFEYAPKRVAQIILQPYQIIWGLISRSMDAKTVGQSTGGPLMIMSLIYAVTSKGLPMILYILALLNAGVGAFNLLPVPALDGSRLFFLIVAWIRKKEIDPEKEARIHYYGLIVLLALVALISIQDVGRIMSGTQLIK